MSFRCSRKLADSLLLNSKSFCTKVVNPMELYEPAFKVYIPEVPRYGFVNFHFKGYDYTVLEKYQKYVDDVFRLFKLKQTNAWAAPGRFTKASLFKPRTAIVTDEFKYGKYERAFQVKKLPTTTASILIDIIRTNLPKGVEFTVKTHETSDDESRYIPEYEVAELQKQIEEVEQKKKKLVMV